jgi:hypothetical protein
MADDYVTVAGFAEPVGAEIARGRLDSEGIPAVVHGGLAASTLFGTSNIAGRVEVRVPAGDVARAVRVLLECGGGTHLSDEVLGEAADEGPVWLCPLCGEPVRAVLPVCHACHTPRGRAPVVNARDDGEDEPEEGIQAYPPAAARPAGERAEEGIRRPRDVTPESPPAAPRARAEVGFDVPPLATMAGDALARRAFLAALFGPAAAGLLSLYSMWLLLRLTFYPGALSARGMRFLYLAVFFDGLYLLLFLLLCAGLG